MKKFNKMISAVLAGLFLVAMTATVRAEDDAPKAKEKTLTGMGKCAKCDMHKTDKCQTVVSVERKNGKVTDYYLTDNDVSKDFHKNVCKENKKIKVTGVVKKGEDGKMEVTASKIELAE
jgi:hypothetical protein